MTQTKVTADVTKEDLAPAIDKPTSTVVQDAEIVIISGEITIPTQGDNMPAYQARPRDAQGPLPVVMIAHEIFGVNEHIRSLCHRLAQAG